MSSKEEKAKAYERALAKARDFNFQGYMDEECLYDMFPELRESEDEKVRKEIIDYCHERLNTTYGALPNIETIKRWLAWLEKHTYTQKDVDDAYSKGVTDANNELEKQSEQILANSAKTCKDEQNDQTNFTEFEEALDDVCRGWIGEEIGWKDYIKTNADAILKISFKMWNHVQELTTKTTWSEEDEKILNQAIEEVEYALNDKSLFYTGNENVLIWLKSLKQRLGGK